MAIVNSQLIFVYLLKRREHLKRLYLFVGKEPIPSTIPEPLEPLNIKEY